MGSLNVREARTPDREPGFPGIGRECDECGHRTYNVVFQPGPCKAHDPVALMKRLPRPRRGYDPHGTICLNCGRP